MSDDTIRRTGPRPYALPSLRFPVETTSGERVYIVRDEMEAGGRVLTSEDGRKFAPAPHGLKVEPLAE